MAKVVGIKFKDAGKLYYFSPGEFHVGIGDNVIVETARGLEFGKVTMGETEVSDKELVAPLKNIDVYKRQGYTCTHTEHRS